MLENEKKIKLTDLIDIEFLQEFQDFFAKTMGVALVSVSNNKRITKPSNSSAFCSKYTRGSNLGCKNCDNCHHNLEMAAVEKRETVTSLCHVGLANFAIPIIIRGQYLATIIGGQVSTEPIDEENLRKIANELGIDENAYLKEATKIKTLSPEKLNAITDSLNLVINSIVAIAYANYQLSELGLNYKAPRNIAVEEWLFLNCDIVKSPLTAREFEVLRLIVLGKNNNEIAKELFISVHTAKAYVSSILEKFSVDDRVQIAVKAVREGFI